VQNATRLQDLCAGGSKELHPSTKPRMTLSVQRKAMITVVTAKKPVNWKLAQKRAARTARWAVIMTKVRIRRVMARTRWQLVTFGGPAGSESTGVVDLLAIRKDHRKPRNGMKRGDGLQIVLIQMKGGGAAMPTAEDAHRLRVVAKRHQVRHVLLASWIKGKPVRIFSLQSQVSRSRRNWTEVTNLDAVFL
jgi:hypothetical protein